MALTPTIQIPLGYKAPPFSLPDVVSGKEVTFDDIKGELGTVVMFICNHCPYVIHIREELVRLANDYIKMGFGFVAISSNDVINYPQDHPDQMKVLAEEMNFLFPYLYDESQEVAKLYDAACTPDFSVFDRDNECVYRGRLGPARPGNNLEVKGIDLRHALDCIANGTEIPEKQYPSMGCNIKWKQ